MLLNLVIVLGFCDSANNWKVDQGVGVIDFKVSNLIKIIESFGYELVLQKGDERLALHNVTKNNKHLLNVITTGNYS